MFTRFMLAALTGAVVTLGSMVYHLNHSTKPIIVTNQYSIYQPSMPSASSWAEPHQHI